MSEKRQLANKQNAQLSTGPRTESGKGIVSLNAMKTGIYSTKIFQMASENEDFQELKTGIYENFRPTNQIEAVLVSLIIENTWRLHLISRTEQGLFKKKELEDTIIKCKEVINLEFQRKGKSLDINSSIMKIYAEGNENEFFKENITIATNVEKLIEAENELKTEPMKLANAFHFDSVGPETFSKLTRYRMSTEHSLYKAIDKLREIQKERFDKESMEAKSVSIKNV